MKKMLSVSMVLILMASMAPLVFAEEVEIDDETQNQIEIMNINGLGPEIRLLQLEEAITKNILKGEEVVNILKDLGYNTTILEVILAELELLLQEVQSADANSTNATQIFVDLKSDAIDLTKDFRDAVRELLDDDTIEQLRERIREMVCEQVQNLSNKIQNRIRQFNRNQLHRIYQITGENGTPLLCKYQNGNITMQQVKQNITRMVNQMTKEQRYELFLQLKQNKIQSQINARICAENATEFFQERQENRLRNRIQTSENMSDNPLREEIEQRIRNRLNECQDDGGSDTTSGNGNAGNGGGQQNGGGDN